MKSLKNKNVYYQNASLRKSKISSLIILLVTFYFAYLAYKAYTNKKSNDNLTFLIATLLVLIASLMRFITLSKNPTISGVEDIV